MIRCDTGVLVVIHRRAFLAGLSAAVTGARGAWAQAAPIESFTQWMQLRGAKGKTP